MCLFISVESSEDPGLTYGHIKLFDLAGSERAVFSSNNDQRLREGANINRSLLSLASCINALSKQPSSSAISRGANSQRNTHHVPYRNSKLTRLLKDSFSGYTLTTMIATISPSIVNIEDTLNTLKYAFRVKMIGSEREDCTQNYNNRGERFSAERNNVKGEAERGMMRNLPSISNNSIYSMNPTTSRSINFNLDQINRKQAENYNLMSAIIRNKEIELHKRLNFESLAPELVCFIPRLKIEQNSEEMMELRKDLDSISKKKKELISVNSFDKRE